MKRFYIFLMVLLASSGSLFAQKLNALISYHPFCSIEMNPYVEFNFTIDGNSVHYAQKANQKYEAEVRITVDIQQENKTIQKLDYILTSGEILDTTIFDKNDFYDIKNIALPNGHYFLNFTIQDMFAGGNKVEYTDHITIKYPKDSVAVSRISLLKNIEKVENPNLNLDKYGYRSTPLLYNFVPANMLFLYQKMEIYNTLKVLGENKTFFVRSYLINRDSRNLSYPENNSVKTYQTANLTLYINQLIVKNLPTGFYILVSEVYSNDSTLLAVSKTLFERENPSMDIPKDNYDMYNIQGTFVEKFNDDKKLKEYVSYLIPIASPSERVFIKNNILTATPDQLKQFFFGFWSIRNNVNPEEEWGKYKVQVDYVNQLYTTGNFKGFKTDRGRVYLQYGAPNSVTESAFDSHSYPYEIWFYNQAKNQYNVSFIFYNTDLVTRDYDLLHSDMIGEFQDPFWKVKLVNRKTPIFNFDDKSIEEYYGNSVEDDFNYMK